MSEPIIKFEKVNKWYGDNFHVLRDIDLEVAPGERIVICGPSGSGKSWGSVPANAFCMKAIQIGSARRPPVSTGPRERLRS